MMPDLGRVPIRMSRELSLQSKYNISRPFLKPFYLVRRTRLIPVFPRDLQELQAVPLHLPHEPCLSCSSWWSSRHKFYLSSCSSITLLYILVEYLGGVERRVFIQRVRVCACVCSPFSIGYYITTHTHTHTLTVARWLQSGC